MPSNRATKPPLPSHAHPVKPKDRAEEKGREEENSGSGGRSGRKAREGKERGAREEGKSGKETGEGGEQEELTHPQRGWRL